jgi:uncharacterized protein (DUF1800 family)
MAAVTGEARHCAMSTPYNRAAAFLAFARGTTIDDISQALAIPLDTLKGWIRNEGWPKLAGDLLPATVTASAPATVGATPAAKAERDLAKIQANRARNLEIAQKFQDDLLRLVQKLQDGTLKVEKVLSTGLKVEHALGLRERVDLATYAKNVAEMSYRALGDVQASREPKGLPTQAATVNIILPAQVAAPRSDRVQVIETEAIPVTQGSSFDSGLALLNS